MSTQLTALPIPVPPQLEVAVDYHGSARYVALYWEPAGDEAMYDDGSVAGTGDWWGYQAYTDHPRIAAALYDYNLGSSDGDAEHWLVIDRTERKAYVAKRNAARAFVAAQHPTPLATPIARMTVEDLLTAARSFASVNVPPFDETEIRRQMTERANLCGQLSAWLTACPSSKGVAA